MDKAMDMGKSSATGSFQLLIGVVGSTVILFLGTFVLSWLLKSEELALYSAAVNISTMINFFRDWGVNAAMTKQIASLRSEAREAEIHDVIVSGVIFEILSGAVLSAICFGLSDVLAAFLKAPEASILIKIMSITIFAGAIAAAAGNTFVGFEKMKLSSLTTILQSVVKTAIAPVLVVLGFGVFGAIIGMAISVLVGGIVAISIVYFVLFRPLRKLKSGKSEISKTLKPMLGYGIPLTISNIVIGVSPSLFAILMFPVAGATLMGNYSIASFFLVILTFFTIPISTALFPTFAKVNPQKEPELLKSVFASSVKYTSLLVVPATMLIMALSSQMVYTLWQEKYPYAPLFLTLTVIINLYTVVGNTSWGSFMTGLGKTRQLMFQSLLSFACSLPIFGILYLFAANLSPMTGAIVGIVGILLSSVPGMIWGLYWIWKNYHAKADYWSSAKILIAAGISSVVSYLVGVFSPLYLQAFGLSFWLSTVVSLVLGFFVFLVLYLALAPIIGAVNQSDVGNMRSMFSGLGIVSKILEIPLKFMEKALKIRDKKPAAN